MYSIITIFQRELSRLTVFKMINIIRWITWSMICGITAHPRQEQLQLTNHQRKRYLFVYSCMLFSTIYLGVLYEIYYRSLWYLLIGPNSRILFTVGPICVIIVRSFAAIHMFLTNNRLLIAFPTLGFYICYFFILIFFETCLNDMLGYQLSVLIGGLSLHLTIIDELTTIAHEHLYVIDFINVLTNGAFTRIQFHCMLPQEWSQHKRKPFIRTIHEALSSSSSAWSDTTAVVTCTPSSIIGTLVTHNSNSNSNAVPIPIPALRELILSYLEPPRMLHLIDDDWSDLFSTHLWMDLQNTSYSLSSTENKYYNNYFGQLKLRWGSRFDAVRIRVKLGSCCNSAESAEQAALAMNFMEEYAGCHASSNLGQFKFMRLDLNNNISAKQLETATKNLCRCHSITIALSNGDDGSIRKVKTLMCLSPIIFPAPTECYMMIHFPVIDGHQTVLPDALQAEESKNEKWIDLKIEIAPYKFREFNHNESLRRTIYDFPLLYYKLTYDGPFDDHVTS